MAAAVTFGVIADARAIQRRRRLWTLLALALLVFASGAFAATTIGHAAKHDVALRITVHRGPGTPPMEQALRTIRAEPGFTKLSVKPALVKLERRRSALRTLLRLYPMEAIVDARFLTTKRASQLAGDLRAKLHGLVQVELVTR